MSDLDDLNDIFDEMYAEQSGQTLEEYRDEVQLRDRLYDESQQYVGTSVELWPKIFFNWNININDQRFSLDAISVQDFKDCYPIGLFLGYVNLSQLDKCLNRYTRRSKNELWSVGCQTRLASLIVYLSEGRPITPPLLKPTLEGEIVLLGGNNRYAIAKAVGINEIPVYVEPEYKSLINSMLPIRWVTA